MDKHKAKSYIADRVLKELTKYWQHSNIPTQTDWWIRQGILSLNKKYEDLLKHIKRDTATENEKRERFVADVDKLFDIASPMAEKQLRKDQVLGMKKAKEDLMYRESQRTDRVAKMLNHDKIYDRNVANVKTRNVKKGK